MITTLATNIEAAIQAALPDHGKLDFVLDVSKNANFKTQKRFGVVIEDAPISGNVVGKITMNVRVDIRLTDGFKEPVGDSGARTASNAIADRLVTLSDHLARIKCGTSGVSNVTPVSISSAEYLQTENIVYRTATLTVTYKV